MNLAHDVSREEVLCITRHIITLTLVMNRLVGQGGRRKRKKESGSNNPFLHSIHFDSQVGQSSSDNHQLQMILKLAFVLSAALPLAASARSYDRSDTTKFNTADVDCSSAVSSALIGTAICDNDKQGRDACDGLTGCTAFEIKYSTASCYLYKMTAELITKCSTASSSDQK